MGIFFQFQDPFRTITYTIIGDGEADTLFSINPNTAAISTRTTLALSTLEAYSVSYLMCNNYLDKFMFTVDG